jgi:hypothetical protein
MDWNRSKLMMTAALLVATAAPLTAQSGRGSAERLAGTLRQRAFDMGVSKGYSPRMSITPRVGEFEVRGPSQAVPIGGHSMVELQASRRCTDAEKRGMTTCLRFDVLEIFTQIDASNWTVDLGVVPHTFIGSSVTTLKEVTANSGVAADAEIIARRHAGRVVRAIPWPAPGATQ